MKLEDQVCSFDQARKINIDCESLYVWVMRNPDSDPELMLREDWFLARENCRRFAWDAWSAYTVAELGILLGCYQLHYDYYEVLWKVTRQSSKLPKKAVEFIKVIINIAPNDEAQARATALIWLIENDFVNVEDLKL